MNDDKSQKVPLGKRIAFAMGEVGDNTAMQTFSFLIFTFYYAIVGVPIVWIITGFIIFS